MTVTSELQEQIPIEESNTGVAKPISLPRSSSRNHILAHVVGLTIAVAIALVVRLVHINSIGYNSDEAVYAGQGAAIAEVPILTDIFPVFRAHPLFFQFLVAVFFKWWPYDWVGRLVSVGVGIVTIFVVYYLGNRLYGKRAGFFAAVFIALMPYHVIVTRQVLLDGSMALFATLTLLMLVRFSETGRAIWLIAAGAGMGLTFLAKETGVLMVGSIYAYLAISPEIRIRIRDIVASVVVMVMVMSPFPLSIRLSGQTSSHTSGNYIVWQLFRRPNHTWDFYPTLVPPAIGILVCITALIGLIWLWRSNGWKEKLMVTWIIVPAVFFQLWPTKGFQYLLPIAMPIAVLAARTLVSFPRNPIRLGSMTIPQYVPGFVGATIVATSLFIPTWSQIQPTQSASFTAGTGGIPGGREMGLWITENVPENAVFMTIGPSMANIIKWYGHHEARGVSVSPNPLRRNPSYDPVLNPDFQLRTGEIQYIVWDSFSAGRSIFFSEKLMWYVERYHGRVVNTQTVTVVGENGETTEQPVIIVYEVHP
jgi:hypothetical protein